MFLNGCGVAETSSSGADSSGTGDDSTATEVQDVTDNFTTVADALVPLMSTATSSSTNAALSVTYDSSTAWDTYVNDENGPYLEEIFGSPDEGFAVVTKIRVLLDSLSGNLEQLLAQDPLLDCTNAVAFLGADMVEIAFYGEILNGTSSDRFYDCELSSDDGVILYGQDADGVIRVVSMDDTTSTNAESVSTRGDQVTIKSVSQVAYVQTTESDVDVAYLDLQYAQATIYNGSDGSFLETSDNVLFKSRSRITGRVELTSTGAASNPVGDYAVTKYDQGQNESGGGSYTIATKIFGRGDAASGGASLFTIDSDASTMLSGEQTFCIEQTSGLPTATDEGDCAAYETALPWSAFPFTLSPEIPASYDDKAFFEADDVDLIASDGSNFTVPGY